MIYKTVIVTISLIGFILAQPNQWELANGTEGIYINDIDIFHQNPDTVYATGNQFLISTDRGENWVSVSGMAFSSVIEVDPFDSKRIYLSHNVLPSDGNEVLITADGGINWDTIFEEYGWPDLPIVETDPGDLNTIYIDVVPNTFYRSSDQGNTWDSIPSPNASGLTSLAIAPSNINILYAAYFGPNYIYKSTDRSQTWSQLPFPSMYGGVLVLAVDPDTPDIVYTTMSAGESRGVYKSIDGGQNWELKNNGIENLDGYDWIQTIVINPKESETLYLGVTSSYTNDQNPMLYESNDGANSWHSFSVGMPEYGTVQTLSVDTMNSRMYAGARNGIYTLDFELSVDEYDFQIPILISLKQNYPNPFNSSTKIAYSLSKNSFVKLTVFDISGKKINRLVNEIKNTGEHSVMWDGTDLNNKSVPSGVYFYVLKNDQGLF
jgi:photosystem II stability/assembly factor-like uncharacterized protein